MELRPVSPRQQDLRLRRLLSGRLHGGEQRGGRLGEQQRRRDRQAVLPRGDELQQLPAGPRNSAPDSQLVADRVAVFAAVPRVPADGLGAAPALPDLRGRAVEQPAIVVGLLSPPASESGFCFCQLRHR